MTTKPFEKNLRVSLIPKPKTGSAVLTLTGERLRYPFVLLQILVGFAWEKANEGARFADVQPFTFRDEAIRSFEHSESEIVIMFDLPSRISERLGNFKEMQIVVMSTTEEDGKVLGWRFAKEDPSQIRSIGHWMTDTNAEEARTKEEEGR